MEWQQLVGFMEVARQGSFTKAAEVTLRSQSAVSQQVKALEDELGCELLERIGKRRLRLTRAGERFAEFAQGVLAGRDSLLEDLGDIKGVPWGQVSLAAPYTTLLQFFPKVMKKYADRFPHVELSVLDRSQQEAIRLVNSGQVDIGLALESMLPAGLWRKRWHKIETVLLAPLGHPLSKKKGKLELAEVARHPLIVPPRDARHPQRARLDEMLTQQGLAARVIVESANVELSAALVEQGMGLAFASIVKGLPALKGRKLSFLSCAHLFKPDYLMVFTRPKPVMARHKHAFLDLLFEASPG